MRFKFAVIAAAAALLANPALAAPEGSGFYAGLGVGMSDLSAGSFSGNDFAFKVFGGYDFVKFFGVEAAYLNGGSPSDHGVSVDVDGWELALRGILPIGERGEVFAKLGYAWWNVDADGFGDDSASDLMYGIGGGFRFGDHLGARLEWERMDIEDTDSADLYTLSGYWKF